MEDSKKDANKLKRSKNEHVKNTITNYLQKRNYSPLGIVEDIKLEQQITYSTLESEINKSNSILYSCYNSDPVVIDHNFTKFLAWIRDLIKNKNSGLDLEQLIGPLFCHLYLDILKGGHSERAAAFFKAHLPAVDKTKCDDFVKDLINALATDSEANNLKVQFRNNKYFIELAPESISLLKKFVAENCHVVFLHILQCWFEIKEIETKEMSAEEVQEIAGSKEVAPDDKLRFLHDVIKDLEDEPKQVFVCNISNVKDVVNCACLCRPLSLIAYDEGGMIHLRPLHSYDPIINHDDISEITLSQHSGQVYSLSISSNHQILVTGGSDSTLSIHHLENFDSSRTCSGHLGAIYCARISSNGAYVGTASADSTARLWDIETGKCLRIFAAHTEPVTCLDFHPNCLYLATGSADHNVRLWNLSDGSALRLFHGSKGVVYAISFHPHGESLASASDDRRIRVWDVLSCKVNFEIKYKGEPITKLVWSQDGRQLCGGAIDGVVRVWDFSVIQENSVDSKNIEPITCFNVNAKLLDVEYALDCFACLTT